MDEKLEGIEAKYEELTRQLSQPDVASDPNRLRELGRAHRELEEIVQAYRELKKARVDAEEARGLAKEEQDAESQAFYRSEMESAERRAAELEERLQVLLLPKDPNDEKNVILEISGGDGGDE